jgi:hypothetical protein
MTSNETAAYENIVQSDSVLRVVSTFDPWERSEQMFDIIKEGLHPYFLAMLGNLVQESLVSMTFLEQLTSYEQLGRSSGEGNSIATFYSNVNVTLYLVSSEKKSIDDFTSKKAALLIRRYFEGDMKVRLEEQLMDAGMKIKDITLFNSVPEDYDDDEPTDNGGGIDNGSFNGNDDPANTTSNQQGSLTYAGSSESDQGSGTSSAFKAAAISGAVAIASIGLLVFAVFRRKRKNWNVQNKSSNQSLSGDSNYGSDAEQSKEISYITDSSTTPRDGPHALPEQYRVQKSIKKEVPASKGASRLFSSKLPSVPSFRLARKATGNAKQNNQIQGGTKNVVVDDVDLIRFEEGPDLIASAACVEGGDDENPKHSDFDMYQQTKPSLSNFSDWPSLDDVSVSTPSYSIAASSIMDEEEYRESRKKWQESANDVESIPVLDVKSNTEQDESLSKADGSVASSDTDIFGFFPVSDPFSCLMEDINLNEDPEEEAKKVDKKDSVPDRAPRNHVPSSGTVGSF